MYTFRRLQLKKMPSIIGWYLVIDNSTDLLELTIKIQKTKAEKAFADEFNIILNKQKHPTDRLNVAINSLSDINGTGWVNSLADLFHKTWYAQRELLEQGYTLLFNRNFGYSIDKDDEYYITLDEYTSDKILFPDYKKDVRYIQWPDGKHWYVKVGDIDVYDKDGNMKWDTKKEAEKAFEWYKGI